jgi:hypothetical protein
VAEFGLDDPTTMCNVAPMQLLGRSPDGYGYCG